jgi:predicted oxidoreductase
MFLAKEDTVKTFRIAGTPLEVTRIAYGCMGIGGGWGPGPLEDKTRKEALVTLQAALDEGINFYDHADIYGRGRCEEAFSGIWNVHPGLRDRIVIQTKCGIRFRDDPVAGYPQRYDYSREHILQSVDGSLKRLNTDYVDILLLHRPDALVEPQEVAEAFDVLQHTGKVRFFGVSNHSPWQIDLLKRWVRQPLVVNQLELNVVHNHLINAGVNVNQGQPGTQADGTLEYCRLHGITIQAWSPVAHGRIANAETKGDELTRGAAEAARVLAARKGVSLDAILVAWLLRHPAGIQPIIGTTRPERIREACRADAVELTREEWYTLFAAGRGKSVA